ncbi:MAG: hypothetical protein CW338_08520 [Clostridiales bacterium]|nr:hypothetical protein [Clostridiales bacterium]
MTAFISPEDYQEPVCPLCMDEHHPVPMDRVMKKLDAFLDRQDYEGARQYLCYWVEEAKLGNDLRGLFTLRNEQMGVYRKTGDGENALLCADEALDLIDRAQVSPSAACNALINAGTVYTAFSDARKANELFDRAEKTAVENPGIPGDVMAGLCNNHALALVKEERWDEADKTFSKAMELMGTQPFGAAEQAITLLNMADARQARYGVSAEKEIEELIEKAYLLLTGSSLPVNGHIAFVYDKCAPIFGYYGYFLYEKHLADKAKAYYSGLE